MTSPFQPFLDRLAQDLQGVLPPEEIQATVADARAHLVDLQSRLIAEGMPPDLAAQQALLDYGSSNSLVQDFKSIASGKPNASPVFTAFYLTSVLSFFSILVPAVNNLVQGREYLELPYVAWIYLLLMLTVCTCSMFQRRIAWKTLAGGLGLFLFFVPFLMAYGQTAMPMPFVYYLPFATAWYIALYAIPHLIGVGLGNLVRLMARAIKRFPKGGAHA